MATLDWLRVTFPDLDNVAPLSQGGQKLVFAARHKADGDVVLKVIKPNQDLETVRREVLAVATVQSARVPKILEYGTVGTPLGDCVWLREQRVNGETVRSSLQAGAFETRRLLTLGLHMLEALIAAEAVRIVHRDVKPDNIISDPAGSFWLLDFGVARHLDLSSLTPTGLPFGKGTLGYCPPEQLRNIKPEIDARADLFGLGVTLYECATGSNPFRAGARDDLEILKRVDRVPLPILRLAFGAAADFRDLVDAMTQKRRDQRPASAAEAYQWIQEICAKEGVK
jgi:serine/threonine protein kinase